MATSLPTKDQFSNQTVTQDGFKTAMNQLIDYLTEYKPFPTGTRMLFQQSSSPVGWTKETSASFNDATFRIVTGATSLGGADGFSTLFGAAKSTAGYALQTADLPAHAHTITDPGHVHNYLDSTIVGGPNIGSNNGFAPGDIGRQTSSANTGITSTNNAGGGTAHVHTLNNMNLKFVDSIVASKD